VLDGGGDAGDEELCRAQSSAVQVLFVQYKVVQLAKDKPARGARVSQSARRVPTGHFSSLVTLTAAYLIQPYFVFLSLFVIELKKHPMHPAVFCTIINNVFEL
jgi:hypothetical protein